MKLNYQKQLTMTIIIVLVTNTLNMIFHQWIFSSIGHGISGLIWMIHPVMPGTKTPTKRDLNLIRLAGAVLFLFGGMFGRLYL